MIYHPPSPRDLFVLMSFDGWNSSMVLNLEPWNENDARQAINWQITGGATRDQMKICRYNRDAGAFAETGNGNRHHPGQSPYTVAAWARFNESLTAPVA